MAMSEVLSNQMAKWKAVTCAVPLGSAICLDGIECTLHKFVADTKPSSQTYLREEISRRT